ncbi:hypothetical protein [Acuticoccus mangrovi]|nr:hypothetical protein [Acuticoccus mangrovi]
MTDPGREPRRVARRSVGAAAGAMALTLLVVGLALFLFGAV